MQRRRRKKLNFTPVVVILCLAMGCGYAAAKYVVDPVVNYVPEFIAQKDGAEESTGSSSTGQDKTVEDEVDVNEPEEVAGYALQFGCYSGRAAADAAMTGIGVSDLQVIEQNNMYKIVGKIYETKDEAKAELEKLPADVSSFVTAIYQ